MTIAHSASPPSKPTDRGPPLADDLRHDWQPTEVLALFELPFFDLLFEAHRLHRAHFDPNRIQRSQLLSIKTGGCGEDCKYCPQSAHYDTGLDSDKLLAMDAVLDAARGAAEGGASRFCMGAAWRNPRDKDIDVIIQMVQEVGALGLETCMTLGMLTDAQAARLADAGLDYYNHNIDKTGLFYGEIITTRTYRDRLDTLARVRDAGMKVCSGGIVGMGERRQDRGEMLRTLANQPAPPESVPINLLVQVPGTPLDDVAPLDPFEFVRTIAVARILMPRSFVRLSAGREDMSDEIQALAFFAGANSVFCGERLLTTDNPAPDRDHLLFERLGLQAL